MAKMVFHFDDGSVIETGPKGRTDSPEDVMKNHTKQMENLLREVERTGKGRVSSTCPLPEKKNGVDPILFLISSLTLLSSIYYFFIKLG